MRTLLTSFRFRPLLSPLSVALLASALPQLSQAQTAHDGNAQPWQMGMTAGASDVSAQVVFFHNYVLLPVIGFICVFVLLLLAIVIFRFSEKKNPVPSKVSHNTVLEVVWTAIPLLILGIMFIPSIRILYFAESTGQSDITVKVVGHQWYWSYVYTDVKSYNVGDDTVKYDSIMMTKEALPADEKDLYRLRADKPLYLPLNKKVKLILTSQDVIHSFSVLPLGLKMDAIPGRNNETWVRATKPGIYYGFCTELCGINHAFMPIEIRVVSDDEFQNWLNSNGGKEAPATKSSGLAPALFARLTNSISF